MLHLIDWALSWKHLLIQQLLVFCKLGFQLTGVLLLRYYYTVNTTDYCSNPCWGLEHHQSIITLIYINPHVISLNRCVQWRTAVTTCRSPADPTSESSSLVRDRDFFSASRILTCSRTLLALATGSAEGPSEGSAYAVHEELGCSADRKQPSAISALILTETRAQTSRGSDSSRGSEEDLGLRWVQEWNGSSSSSAVCRRDLGVGGMTLSERGGGAPKSQGVQEGLFTEDVTCCIPPPTASHCA